MKGNQQYKDSVFTMLFKDKKKLIELYNAIKGTNYSEDTEIQINTLEKVLYLDRENDISFTIDGKFIILMEHQSTINKNMPLRFLMYIARVYEKIITNESVYKESLIKIPTPEFYVLYNGTKEYPQETILRLSDAFLVGEHKNNLELEVKVININYEKNPSVLKKSKTLEDYSYFIYEVKKYKQDGMGTGEAIQEAMKTCIRQGILKEFLETHGSEVENMLYTEFNLEDALKVRFEEGIEEGIEKGIEEGIEKGKTEEKVKLIRGMLKNGLTMEQIIKICNMSREEVERLITQIEGIDKATGF